MPHCRRLLLTASVTFIAGCNIVIDGGGDCPSLEESCPNLSCENGFAENADGCAICECAQSGPTVCWDDGDCASDRHCDHVNFCEPPPNCDEGEACPDVCFGVCVVTQASCESDADCADGAFCNFGVASNAGSGDAPSGGATDPAAPAPPEEERPTVTGVCTPIGCGDVAFEACPPGTEPILDFTNDDCGQARCVPIDGCRALDPQICDVTPGCHSEALPCPCDDATGACPECAQVICVADSSGCEGLSPEECAANPDCEGFFVGAGCDVACTGMNCAPCSGTPDDFVCVAKQDTGACFSDADCLSGQICSMTQTCARACDVDDNTGAETCVDDCWTEGVCIDSSDTCWNLSPEECLNHPECILSDSTARPAPCACDPNVNTCDCGGTEPAPIEQFCQPAPAPTCFDDFDCGQGQHCVTETYCPPCNDSDPACLAPCWIEGHCVDGDPPPSTCANGELCPDGTVCTLVTICTDCMQPQADGSTPPPDCVGSCGEQYVCVAPDPVTCLDDGGCAEGERCNLDVCASTSDPNNPDAPAVCYGVCEAVPPVTCYSDTDCCDPNDAACTQFCDYSQGCFAGGPAMLVALCGMCSERPPEPVYCSDEAGVTCPDGLVCPSWLDSCPPDPTGQGRPGCWYTCSEPQPPPPDDVYCLDVSDCVDSNGVQGECRFPSDPNDPNTQICLSNPASATAVCWGYCAFACGDAITAATDPDTGKCLVFNDTCTPPGWTQNGSACAATATP